MFTRYRRGALLALLGLPFLGLPLWGLPPCGTPGTITTVTAPDGTYLAAFSDYTIYPPVKYETVGGPADKVAAPEYRSYYPQELALGPQGRIYVADQTIIYRLEADGTATRIVGVPQYHISYTEDDYDYDRHPLGYDELNTYWPPILQRFNVLEDTVAALDARIAPGAMAFDRQGRLYFVDYVNRKQTEESYGQLLRLPVLSRIARLEADGQVVTFVGPFAETIINSLAFDQEGHLLFSGNKGIRRIDAQRKITTLVEVPWSGSLRVDGQGVLYFRTRTQVFRRQADGVIDHVAGSDWGDPFNRDDRRAMRNAALEGEWESEERLGGYFVANGRLATEAPFYFSSDLAIDSQGTLYIANSNFNRIHRVRPDGILQTIAGNGVDASFSLGCNSDPAGWTERCRDHIGDGGSAMAAPIWHPSQLLLTPEGDLLVAMSVANIMWWTGGVFSHLRRICRVSEWMVSPAVTVVEEQASANLAEEALSALRLFPNPFNAAVTITFDLAHSASVSVHIYNELGQQVRVLAAEGVRPAGSYQLVWDGRDQAGQFQASGTYLLVFSVDGAVETHKLTLLH
ncbi:MAG: T9SS type A sorting domain-containing protein [Gemmatimonadetes bacterium]|nr:T9SS type A sorting domain-containing protein [Gemmatimonadota bacterium]MYB71746.1 T9SS type A sorting domain-containing protein [Gemmatimonadota bacterium]